MQELLYIVFRFIVDHPDLRKLLMFGPPGPGGVWRCAAS